MLLVEELQIIQGNWAMPDHQLGFKFEGKSSSGDSKNKEKEEKKLF